MDVFVFYCKVAVLALYLDSLHCIGVSIMAAVDIRAVLSPEVLQSYRELFGIAPERHYTDAQCDEYVEQYVHMMNSRTHFTENVAFNIVYDGRMKLVVCVSTPASTRILNDQMRIMDERGLIGIGDAYMWAQLGSGVEQYRFI